VTGWSAGHCLDVIFPGGVLRMSAARTGRPPGTATRGVCGKKVPERNELVWRYGVFISSGSDGPWPRSEPGCK